MKKFFSVLAVFGLFLCPACAQAADSTSFNPVLVPVKAKGSGGVPVGTIVAWPSWTNPSDMDNWLECNGQWVNPAVYPELSAIVGGNVPDYQGLFLRGVGGTAAGLGVLQGDTLRAPEEVSGSLTCLTGWGGTMSAEGAFSFTNVINATNWKGSDSRHSNARTLELRLAGAWNPSYVGTETRPVNKSVRYFIRARQ